MIPKRRNTFGSETYLVFQTDCLVTEKKKINFKEKQFMLNRKYFIRPDPFKFLCLIYAVFIRIDLILYTYEYVTK